MKIIIATYKRYDLAKLSAAAISKFCTGFSSIILADGSGSLKSLDNCDDIIHIKFNRNFAFPIIKSIFKNESFVCIDDDIILIDYLNLSNYRSQCIYKTPHSSMVTIYHPNTNCVYNLSTIRLNSSQRFLSNKYIWINSAINNSCELVDSVWLHIDKGSNESTVSRNSIEHQIINYIT